jgi:hypothetical protein
MINVALDEKRSAFVALDCEEWQAQGPSLDRIKLIPAKDGRPAASIGNKISRRSIPRPACPAIC